MRIQDAVASAPFPRGDAEIILAHLCGKPRTWIVAYGERALTPEQEHWWDAFRRRREQGEPVAYITGEREFFGRSFHVDRSVLIPRPSTEGLVEMALALMRRKSAGPFDGAPVRGFELSQGQGQDRLHPQSEIRILDADIVGYAALWDTPADIRTFVDMGTGSGCIAVTLACELPGTAVVATDSSAAALNIARANARRHGVGERIRFTQGNLLEPAMDIQNPFLLVANPPYIPEKERLPHAVAAYEPATALRAGPDGLAILRPLLAAARSHPACRGFVVECRADQIDERTTENDNAML